MADLIRAEVADAVARKVRELAASRGAWAARRTGIARTLVTVKTADGSRQFTVQVINHRGLT